MLLVLHIQTVSQFIMHLIPPSPTYSSALLQEVSSLSLPSSVFPSLVNYSYKCRFCKISLKEIYFIISYTPLATVLFFYPLVQRNFLILPSFIINLFVYSTETALVNTNDSSPPHTHTLLSQRSVLRIDIVNLILLFKHVFHLAFRKTLASPSTLASISKPL